MTTVAGPPGPLGAGNRPTDATSSAGAAIRTTALVVGVSRHGALIEAGGQRWLLEGAPPLARGARLELDVIAMGRETQARLRAINDRPLEPPVAVRLRPPAAGAGGALVDATRRPPGLPVQARPVDAAGRPSGPVLSIRLSLPAPDRPGAPPAAPGLAAEVVARDPQGRVLLKTDGQRLRIEPPLDLPVGARLQLVPSGRPADPPAAHGDPWRAVLGMLRGEPAAGADPSGPRPAEPGPALAARVLRWMAALQEAAAAATTDEPDAGTASETAALHRALAELGRSAREAQPGGWRIVTIPLGLAQPDALRLYLRETPADPEHGTARRDRRPASRRAIFACDLSELGPCQLDALCQNHRFDLLIRTERRLAPELRQTIRELFAAACEIGGLSGRVDFRAAGLLRLPAPQTSGTGSLTV